MMDIRFVRDTHIYIYIYTGIYTYLLYSMEAQQGVLIKIVICLSSLQNEFTEEHSTSQQDDCGMTGLPNVDWNCFRQDAQKQDEARMMDSDRSEGSQNTFFFIILGLHPKLQDDGPGHQDDHPKNHHHPVLKYKPALGAVRAPATPRTTFPTG